jgi:hypothetical protein
LAARDTQCAASASLTNALLLLQLGNGAEFNDKLISEPENKGRQFCQFSYVAEARKPPTAEIFSACDRFAAL